MEDVFGRSVADSPRAHHLYTTKADGVDPAGTGRRLLAGVSSPLLVVRYRAKRWLLWTNGAAALGVLAASVILLRAAVFDAVGVAHGSLLTVDYARALAPLILTVLLIFTLERHNNTLLSRFFRPYAVLALVAVALLTVSLIVHAYGADPGSLPGTAVHLPWMSGAFAFVRSAALAEGYLLSLAGWLLVAGAGYFMFVAPFLWALVTGVGVVCFWVWRGSLGRGRPDA